MFPWKLQQYIAVLGTFTELGRALDTLLSNVLLNFCPNLAAAALTCDTQRCSFTQNPTHKCDTETLTLFKTQLTTVTLNVGVQQFHIEGNTAHCNCSAILLLLLLLLQNVAQLPLSMLGLVEFHCGPQLSQSVSSGMKWIWIAAYMGIWWYENMRTQGWEGTWVFGIYGYLVIWENEDPRIHYIGGYQCLLKFWVWAINETSIYSKITACHLRSHSHTCRRKDAELDAK